MTFNTSKLVLGAAVMSAAAFTTIAAKAQATLDVPFGFNVDGIVCPAGTYSVERAPYGAFVSLKGKDGREIFHWALGPGDASPTDSRIVLKFDELDQTYMLRSVQYRSLITSRLDKSAQRYKHGVALRGQGQ